MRSTMTIPPPPPDEQPCGTGPKPGGPHPVAGNRRFEIQEVITMKNTSKPVYNLEDCLDILDWFNDPDF